jgi:hypothetical protein
MKHPRSCKLTSESSHTSIFSIKFIHQNLYGLSGGVSESKHTNDTGLVHNCCTDYHQGS